MAQTVRPSASTGPSAPARSQIDPDWTVQATDTIESVVTAIRDKTVVPITTIARGIVYGLIAGVLGLVALVLVAITLIRFLDVYLPFDPLGRRVWVADTIVGGIFTLAGLFFLRKAKNAKR
jgi:hypothetical protein